MDYYDSAMQLLQEIENVKYEHLKFSFDMSLRDFIQWFLNIEVGYIFLLTAIIFLISVIYNIWLKK